MEKQIKEMTDIIHFEKIMGHSSWRSAEKLYNAGYRNVYDIFTDIEKAYIEAKEEDIKFEMGFEYEWNKRLDELKKKYEVSEK